MTGGKMHVDEIDITVTLVQHLIADQFPEFSSRPIEKLSTGGTENAIFRLGDDLAVRMPRIAGAARQAEKEFRWLPALAADLTLDAPMPVRLGQPGEGYPHLWSICRWLDGQDAFTHPVDDLSAAAETLAAFVVTLRNSKVPGSSALHAFRSGRGVDLPWRDAVTREALARCAGLVDADTLLKIWDDSLAAPKWHGPPR